MNQRIIISAIEAHFFMTESNFADNFMQRYHPNVVPVITLIFLGFLVRKHHSKTASIIKSNMFFFVPSFFLFRNIFNPPKLEAPRLEVIVPRRRHIHYVVEVDQVIIFWNSGLGDSSKIFDILPLNFVER